MAIKNNSNLQSSSFGWREECFSRLIVLKSCQTFGITVFCSWYDHYPRACVIDALSVHFKQDDMPPSDLSDSEDVGVCKIFPSQDIPTAPVWPVRHWYTNMLQMTSVAP